jgi:hypothetical protein
MAFMMGMYWCAESLLLLTEMIRMRDWRPVEESPAGDDAGPAREVPGGGGKPLAVMVAAAWVDVGSESDFAVPWASA